MKNLKQLVVLAIVALFAFTACKDDKKAQAAALAAEAARTADSIAAAEKIAMETKKAEEEAAAAAALAAAASSKTSKTTAAKAAPAPAAKPAAKPAPKPAPKPKAKPAPAKAKPAAPPADINTQGEATMLGGGDRQLGQSTDANVLKRSGRDNVLTVSEVKPAYPGGETAMMKFLSKNVKYPSKAKEDGVKGTVFVKFVVEKDGTVDDVTVAKGVHPLLDAEAIRVVKAMPKWAAGKQAGQSVATQFTLPVKFQLVE